MGNKVGNNLYQERLENIKQQKEILEELAKLFQKIPTPEEVNVFFNQYELSYPNYYYIEALKTSSLPANTQENVNRYYYEQDIYYKTHPMVFSNTWTENDVTEEERCEKLNSAIVNYIDQNLPKDITDTLDKAIAIYILLGDIVRYDSRYLYHQDFGQLERIDDVTPDNNEIICRSWAIIYQKLLEHYHIQSDIYGKFHLSVTLPYKKTIYDVDGFAFGADEILSDVARIHFGIGIKAFKVLEVPSWNEEEEHYKQQELEERIDKIYKKLQRPKVTEEEFAQRLLHLSERLKNTSKGLTEREINRRIQILNWFYQMPIGKSANLERYQMLRKYSHFLFDDLPASAIRKTSVYEKSKEDIYIRSVIRVDREDDVSYFLQGPEGFKKTTKEEMKEMLEEGTMIPRHKLQAEQFFGLNPRPNKRKIRVKN